MLFRTFGFALLSAASVAGPATAQTTPAAPAITRTVVATTKLPTVVAVPLHFRAVGVYHSARRGEQFLGCDGVLYQMSGSTEVSTDGGVKTTGAGEGLFIASGKQVSLKAGSGEPSTFLHFLLVSATALNQPAEGSTRCRERNLPHGGTDFRLKPGSYDLNRRGSLSQRACPRTRHTIGLERLFITSCLERVLIRSKAKQSKGGRAL